MRNTTIADLIKGINDMDRTLALPKRTGLSKLRKVDLVALHNEVLEHFLKVTQPEVDKMLEEEFYHCEQCGGENVLKASREAHEQRVHGAVAKQEASLEEMRKESELEGYYDEPYQQKREQAAKIVQPYRRQGPASGRIMSRKATGPIITVVCRVGRKLVMGQVVGTVTRPMAMLNPNLVAVRHLTDAGHPRVTLHAPKELAY